MTKKPVYQYQTLSEWRADLDALSNPARTKRAFQFIPICEDKIIGQTEKAYKVRAPRFDRNANLHHDAFFWLPKSLAYRVLNDNPNWPEDAPREYRIFIPRWFAEKMTNENGISFVD